MATSPSLTVAMITMNEAGAVRKVVEEIRAAAGDAEILLVDSSADATPQIAAELGCVVLRQFPPRGYGPAMTRALREASGDVVVTLDCDDTYPAEVIPELVARVEAGADLVNASRLQRRPQAMPFANYLANCLFAWTARLLFGLRTTDVHSGMRAYRKSMLDRLAREEKPPALPVALLVAPHRLGFRVEEIGIDYRERIGTTTLRPLSGALWTFRRLLGLRFAARRTLWSAPRQESLVSAR